MENLCDMYITFDLETLGNTSNAPIVQIGAVVFDIDGNIVNEISLKCDVETIPPNRFNTDYSTIKWWLQQMVNNKNLIEVFKGELDFYDMISQFSDWVKTMMKIHKDLTFWSHATFDPPILNNNFKNMGIKNPIPFRSQRDIRTLTHIAGHIDVKGVRGDAHNALDDAIFQAKYISKGLRVIKDKGLQV